jgi:hypothetical protein
LLSSKHHRNSTLPDNQLVNRPEGDITEVLYKKIDDAKSGDDLVKAKEFSEQYVNDVIVLEGKEAFYGKIKGANTAKQLRAVMDDLHAELGPASDTAKLADESLNVAKLDETQVAKMVCDAEAQFIKLGNKLLPYWKSQNMINKTMVADVKKTLGLYDIPKDTSPAEAWQGLVNTKAKLLSYKNMTTAQKRAYIEELNKRVHKNMEAKMGALENATPESLILDTLNATPERLASRPNVTKESRTIAESALKLGRTISSRLWDIHPKLKAVLRTVETWKVRAKKALSEKSHPVVLAMAKARKEAMKVPNGENLVTAMDQALLMSQRDLALTYAERLGIRKEVEQGLRIGDELAEMLMASGEKMVAKEDYWARQIVDYKGFTSYMMRKPEHQGFIHEALYRREHQIGTALSQDEKMEVIGMAMRGYLWDAGKQIYVPANFVKGRKVPLIDMDMAKFYAKPEDALVIHINDALSRIAFNKLWGKEINIYGGQITDANIGAATLNILEDLAKSGKTLSWEQQEIIREQLKAEFMPKLPGFWTQTAMNASYSSQLADAVSALSNLGEYATMAWKDGIFNVAKSHFGEKVTLEMSGLEPLIQEMENAARSGNSAKVLDVTMRMGGFRWMDVAMKNLNLTSSFHKLASKASNPAEFTKYIDEFGLVNFDPATIERIRGEFLTGAKSLSDEGWQLMLSDLADKQRILPSGSTYAYARGGNTRIFQLFKGQPILIMNMVADEVKNAVRSGNKAKAVRLAMTGVFALYLAGAGPDVIRKYIRKGEIDWSDELTTNLARMFFVNSYAMGKGYNGGSTFTSIASGFLPSIVGTGDAIIAGIRDAVNKGDFYPEQAIRSVPVVGDPLYYGKSIYDRTRKNGDALDIPDLDIGDLDLGDVNVDVDIPDL